MFVFIVIELLLGGLVGNLVLGKYKSIHLNFLLQGLLNLGSYFIGGIIVGLISPGIRISEPAWGAFFSVTLMLLMTIFTPYKFLNFSVSKMLIGGLIAWTLALAGAKIGERIAGNRTE